MRPRAIMPLGAAVMLLGYFLLFIACGRAAAEVGGRHIRRITAADLPSSNNSDVAKIKFKKLHVRNVVNCTTGSCNNSSLPTTAPPLTSGNHSESTSKSVSSFVADNVLQGRLHTDVRTHLTTTALPFDGGYESFFDEIVTATGDFNSEEVRIPKHSSFRDRHHPETEASNFESTLTTPRISLFDDFHARVTEGIRQNLEELDDHKLHDRDSPRNEREFQEPLQRFQSVAESQISPTKNSKGKGNESIALEFSSNFSLVYNDSRKPTSIRKDLVVENGTHLDFERLHIHTKLEPEVNRTVSYVSNHILPNVSPTTETVDSKKKGDGKHNTDSSKPLKLLNLSGTLELAEGVTNKSQTNSSGNFSGNLDTSASTNMLKNNTGSPGDKESTTSEPIRGRSYSRSLKPMNSSSNEEIVLTSEKTNTQISTNVSSANDDKKGLSNNLSSIRNNSGGKDPESNAVAPLSSDKSSVSATNVRGGRMLISTTSKNNTKNTLDEPSEAPVSGSPEKSFNNDAGTKKSRARYASRRNGTNKTEEQMEASTAPLHTTERTVIKTEDSSDVPEDNAVLSQTSVNTTVPGSKRASDINDTVSVTNSPSEVAKESSTLSNSITSRSRAYSYRRTYPTSTTPRSSGSSARIENAELTTRSSVSTSANIEAVRRRMSTVRQTTTPASIVLFSSSNITTDSNTIVRGWPVVARRPSVIAKLSPNRTLALAKTDNNEGNDIITNRNNLYKHVTRNRGTVRYGNFKNDTSTSYTTLRNASTFDIPPTAAALATLKGPRNETRFVRQPLQESNSTSSESNTTQIKSTSGRWSPTRGRKPWNSQEKDTTPNSSDSGNSAFNVTTKSTTKLSPVTEQKQVTRTRNPIPPKKAHQASMQENRLSSVLIAAPPTDQYESTTEDVEITTFRTLYSNDYEDLSSSSSPLDFSAFGDLTTVSEVSTQKSSYSTTEATAQATSSTAEVSTLRSTSNIFVSDASSRSDISSESLLSNLTTETSFIRAESVTSDSEPFDTTAGNFETTTGDSEKISNGDIPLREVSTQDSASSSVSASEDSVITSTSGYLFEKVTTVSPLITTNPFVLEEGLPFSLKKGENDQQDSENPEGDSGSNSAVSNEANNNAGDTSVQGEEIKQLVNSDIVQEDGDNNRPLNGDGVRTGSGSSFNQGDQSGINPDDDENKNPESIRQADDEQAAVEKLPERPSGGDDSLPIQEDSLDLGGPEGASFDHNSAPGVTTPEVTTIQSDTSSLPSSDEIRTSKSVPDEPATFPNEPTTTWSSSSSTSAIEWERDLTTLPTAADVSFYLILTVKASWPVLCDKIQQFKKSVVNLMERNDRPITTYQVILPNVDAVQCQNAGPSTIEVEMYLVDEDSRFEPDLTSEFYRFWKLSGLPDFTIEINTVEPVGQTPEASHDDGGGGGGMIAAITISCIGAVCLLLLAVLWVVMRKRQQKFNYGQRCTPVSLDAYSLDSVSVCGSVRRKGVLRNSKRSYGNAGFDDPGSPSHPMGFAGLANFILNREAMEEEFANIPQVTANVDELPEGADTKNRYSNVIPLPETRVQLSPIEGEPFSEYINANFVHGPKNSSKYYIACQAPLTSTVNDFWRMIWEQQSKVILMLTDLVENGVEKSADYLPPSEVLDCHRLFGDFQITLKKREVKEKYIISTLQLKNLETNSWREVMHLWYVSWPAQGVPDDVSSVIAFLLEARPYMRGGPCVVHCSPGTGRTGTVLACDLCIRDFETARIVDIPRCVARLRRDRAGAVQTRDQYVFIYQVINLYGAKLTGGALDSM